MSSPPTATSFWTTSVTVTSGTGAAFALSVLLYSQGLQMLLGYSMPAFPGSQDLVGARSEDAPSGLEHCDAVGV